MGLIRVVVTRILADAAAVLAVIALFVMLAAQGGRFSDRLDILTHFTPFCLILAMAAAMLAALTPAGLLRRATVVMAAAAILLCASHIGPEFLRDAGPKAAKEAPPTLKLIQMNTWGGRNGSLEETAAWLAAQDADIIVVEEAYGPVRKALEALSGYHRTCSPDDRCEVVIYSRAAPVAVGTEPVAEGAFFPSTRATFAAPGGDFTVIGAHFTWPIPAGPQQQQSLRLAAMAGLYDPERLIIAGDFNSTPWSFSLRRQDAALSVPRRTQGVLSWPAVAFSRWRLAMPTPFLPIDHVYAGRDWKTVSVARGPALGSDHFPIVVTLALAD